MSQSHTQVVAVPTSADAWTDFTAFAVPAGAKRISKIGVATSIDEADPAGVRCANIFRLLGSGILEQSPHTFLGQMGNITAKTTSGAFAAELNPVVYDVDIPVSVGGTIQAQVNSLDEVQTAGTCGIEVIFDDIAPSQKNSMSDHVDATRPAAAGAWSTVGTLRVPTLTTGNNPSKIKEICLGYATDQATLSLLRCASRFRMTGSGLAEGGLHEFLGPFNGTGCNTAGILGYDRQMIRLPVEIPVNPGGDILVEAREETDVPTDGTVVCGVLYA